MLIKVNEAVPDMCEWKLLGDFDASLLNTVSVDTGAGDEEHNNRRGVVPAANWCQAPPCVVLSLFGEFEDSELRRVEPRG